MAPAAMQLVPGTSVQPLQDRDSQELLRGWRSLIHAAASKLVVGHPVQDLEELQLPRQTRGLVGFALNKVIERLMMMTTSCYLP